MSVLIKEAREHWRYVAPLLSKPANEGDDDEANRPMPSGSGVEVLRYLMQKHCLSQIDLPEIGTQSVLSEILGGKRQLNARQIRVLAERFGVPADVFF